MPASSSKRGPIDDSSRRTSKSGKFDDAEKEAFEAKMQAEEEACIRSRMNNHPARFPNTPWGKRSASAFAAKHKTYGAAVGSLTGATAAESAAWGLRPPGSLLPRAIHASPVVQEQISPLIIEAPAM